MENEKLDNFTKISVQEFFIIHSALAETYNMWLAKFKNKSFEEMPEEQMSNVLRNIYETYLSVDKLIEPYKEEYLEKVKQMQSK